MDISHIRDQIIASLKDFSHTLSTWEKDKTSVDLWAHERLMTILSPFGYPLFSEEGDDIDRQHLETFWIIDPLDGTLDFTQGTPYYSVLIALVHKGFPILGINLIPSENKIYYAQKDHGAFYIDADNKTHQIKVSTTDDISKARLVASRNHFSRPVQTFADQYKLPPQKLGSNGYKVGLITEGKADLFFNPTDKMGLWDVCALDIIIQEAGGSVTDGKGFPINYRQESRYLPFGIVVSNTIMHRYLIDFTKTLYE